MYAECETEKPRLGTTGTALVVLAATTTVSMLAPRWVEPAGAKMLAALSIAAGIVAMAWMLAREGRYPRWSFYGAAFVSIVSVFASLLLSGPQWMKSTWPTLLIYPSYFMIFMTSRRGLAPARAAWAPIAASLILGAAMLVASLIARRS